MLGMFVFYIFAIISIIMAVFVLISKNPVYSALSLVTVMFSLGIIFLVLGSPFAAVIQILVYIGAIMVLFVFVIMILNLKKPILFSPESNKRRILGLLFAHLFFGQIAFIIGYVVFNPQITSTDYSLRTVFLTLMTKYLLPFELISVLALVAIVGAIYISTPVRKVEDKK